MAQTYSNRGAATAANESTGRCHNMVVAVQGTTGVGDYVTITLKNENDDTVGTLVCEALVASTVGVATYQFRGLPEFHEIDITETGTTNWVVNAW